MALITDATALAMLKMAGAETFSTGRPEKLWAVFDVPSVDGDGLPIPVRSRAPVLRDCRESDIAVHELIKNSVITRDADGRQYTVRDFDHDGGGATNIVLGS